MIMPKYRLLLIETRAICLKENQYITKSKTCLVESWNCRLRHDLARLQRRTLCYSKNIEALRNAVLLLIHKKIALSVFI